jgi:rod shape-determining protein MreB and related proteins
MPSKFRGMMQHPALAIDFGTANTRIYNSSDGKTVERPSSLGLVTGTVENITDEYFQYINNKIAIKPLRCGVIVDLKNATLLVKPFIRKTGKYLFAPITLTCAPTGTTEKERDSLRRALMDAGASQVPIIPEIWAAANGAGIDLTFSVAQCVVDITAGVTDLAVFRDGRIIHCDSIRLACNDLQRAVRSTVMSKYRFQIFDIHNDKLTHILSTLPLSLQSEHEKNCATFDFSGIDIVKRKEVRRCITKKDIGQSIEPVLQKIMAMIERSLKRLPEKLYCELLESEIILTGGGACLEGMDRLIAYRTNMQVRVSSDPLHSVINGAIQTLNFWNGKKRWWENMTWPKLACL